MDAALLGLADDAYSMVMDRAVQPPPPGYRYPTFAQHYQVHVQEFVHIPRLHAALCPLLRVGLPAISGSLRKYEYGTPG